MPLFRSLSDVRRPLTTVRLARTETHSVELQHMPPATLAPRFRRWHMMSVALAPEYGVERIGEGTSWRGRLRFGDVGLHSIGFGERITWPEGVEALYVHLDPSLLGGSATRVRETPRLTDRVLQDIGFAIRDTPSLEGEHRARSVAALVGELAGELRARFAVESAVVTPTLGALSLDELLAMVHHTLADPLPVERLAARARLSRAHFSRRFHRLVGLSPYAYQLRCRVEWAKFLLGQPGATLAAVAAECGFADQAHLTRTFVRLIGATPCQYRREQSAS